MLLSVTITPINAATVITVDEAKKHCHVDFDTWDNEFDAWIRAATEALQVFTGIAFVPSNITEVRRYYPDMTIDYTFSNGIANIQTEHVGDNVTITYTAGTEPTGWMKQAVKMYVADLFASRGESDLTDWNANSKIRVGERAKQYCKSFISHGHWF